jgi:hypothetical protein
MAGDLEELCAIAAGAATGRGHVLTAWSSPPGEESAARRATCARCGRVAYVRTDTGLSGMTGRALTEQCSERRAPADA